MPIAMVTGPTSGIGRATALSLASQGFHIAAAARSERKALALLSEIEAIGGTGEFVRLDLSDLSSAREAAQSFENGGAELNVLVNNAAAGPRRGLTVDGFELQFGVNHLGHFMLTHHLRRTFRPGTRIIHVTSSMYERAEGIDWDRVRRKSRSPYALKEYAVSKLANILFVRELAAQQPDWRTYAVHPGMTDTDIVPFYARPLLWGRLRTPEEGAETVVWCATAEEVADSSGGYYASRSERQVTELARDTSLASDLRRRSEMWCGVAPMG
jgi:NAD(P)-dependent dehydrogenase (short-subunit alcohol dehydrogenase family)